MATSGHGVDDLAQFRERLSELRQEMEPPTAVGAYEANTDGASRGNPGAGWGSMVEHLGGSGDLELWGHLSSTSNNRAEALAVLAVLEWLPAASAVSIRADSELTLRLLEGRYKVKANPDIWAEIRRVQQEKGLQISTQWVRGHAGDPGNERADSLANLGAANGDVTRAVSSMRPAAPRETPPELVGVTAHSPWEDFLASVRRQLRGGRALSEKQQAIVNRMRGKT